MLLQRLRRPGRRHRPRRSPRWRRRPCSEVIISPEMRGSMVGVNNGQTFSQVEINPEMISFYLGEFSITYKPVKLGCLASETPLLPLHPPHAACGPIKTESP